jgi:membrane associated rhomboid family serine protease
MTDARATALVARAFAFRGTLVLAAALSFVYAVELLVWATRPFETFAFVFVAGARPSPGWLLAPVAHSPLRPWHFPASLLGVLVYGALVERVLGSRGVVWFAVAAGYYASAVQVVSFQATGTPPGVEGVLGASGAVLALATFAVGRYARERSRRGHWHPPGVQPVLVGGVLVVALTVGADLLGGGLATRTATAGHVAGVVFGAVATWWLPPQERNADEGGDPYSRS